MYLPMNFPSWLTTTIAPAPQSATEMSWFLFSMIYLISPLSDNKGSPLLSNWIVFFFLCRSRVEDNFRLVISYITTVHGNHNFHCRWDAHIKGLRLANQFNSSVCPTLTLLLVHVFWSIEVIYFMCSLLSTAISQNHSHDSVLIVGRSKHSMFKQLISSFYPLAHIMFSFTQVTLHRFLRPVCIVVTSSCLSSSSLIEVLGWFCDKIFPL